jgi:hypothetical protein
VTALRGGVCPEPPPDRIELPGDIGVLQGYNIKSRMARVPNRYSATRARLLYGVSRVLSLSARENRAGPAGQKPSKQRVQRISEHVKYI